jgi:hypothetical protein
MLAQQLSNRVFIGHISPASRYIGHISANPSGPLSAPKPDRSLIEGALTGDPATDDATLKFSVLTGIAAMIETVPLEKAPEAYARMMAGKARLRMVLTMQPRCANNTLVKANLIFRSFP